MDACQRLITSIQSLAIDLPPSCIEFCPAHPDYFVIGTYNLQKEEAIEAEESCADNQDGSHANAIKPQSRNGSLVVYRLTEDANNLLHVQTVSYPSALLDLRFHPRQDKHEVFATVSSTGSLSFFRLSPCRGTSAPLDELATHKPLGDDEGVLFLSCAWHPSLPNLLAITTSDHHVHILRVDESWNAYQTSSVPIITHTLEAWTVAFSPVVSPQDAMDDSSETARVLTIYSGSDDSKLLTIACFCIGDQSGSIENHECHITTPYPAVVAKGHTAGVTAILPLPMDLSDGSQVVLSGSYDDHVRVYSIHARPDGVMLRPPRILAETDLGGGVWRLKLVRWGGVGQGDGGALQRTWSALVLASCMHAGCRVLEITGDYSAMFQTKVNVLGRFEEHKSMNYGSDFQPGTELSGGPLRCISTSFYDRLICLWEF